LPPGRARLVTIPPPIGSPVVTMTIGMLLVAFRAARAPGFEPTTMTSTPSWTSDAASRGSRSALPSANRVTSVKLRPSTHQLLKPLPKRVHEWSVDLGREGRQSADSYRPPSRLRAHDARSGEDRGGADQNEAAPQG